MLFICTREAMQAECENSSYVNRCDVVVRM